MCLSIHWLRMEQTMMSGTSISQQPRRYSSQIPPCPLPSPFSSFPSLPPSPISLLFPSSPLPPVHPFLSSRPLHSPPAAKLEGLGALYAPQWGVGQSPMRYRFWCILRGKNWFDSNYYMSFCILKFVKLLIKSPKIVLGAFVANSR